MTRSVLIVASALFVFSAPASGASDVCALEGAKMNATLEKGAAEIARAYAASDKQLSLNGASGKLEACNWDCGGDVVVTPMSKAFDFLQYNCAKTTASPSTRRPTGEKTQSQMGLSITDAEYRDEADALFRSDPSGVGDLMRVPPSLEEASKSAKVQDLIDAVEAIPGAQWLKFSSTSVDNDNQGAARILIRVPDEQKPPRFEQWIQIAIRDSDGKLGRNVDFIGHQLESDPKVVAFRGYSRTSGGFVPEGGSSKSELSKCYSCHPSGLRPVVPAKLGTKAVGGGKAIKPEGTLLEGDDLAAQLDKLKTMTSQLAVFGPAGYLAAEDGPRFGPSDRPGRAEFVKAGCAKGLNEKRREAIVAQMDCEMCHDGETNRGILNAGTSRATLLHKVAENTLAPMPPGVTDLLSAAERQVLYSCLKAEYAELLREWLISDRLMQPESDSSEPTATDADESSDSGATSDSDATPGSDATPDSDAEDSGATSEEE